MINFWRTSSLRSVDDGRPGPRGFALLDGVLSLLMTLQLNERSINFKDKIERSFN
jgi:hypothetical protein